MDKPQIICHLEKSVPYTLMDVKWIPGRAKIVTMGNQPNGKGILELFEVTASSLQSVKQIDLPESVRVGTFGTVHPDSNGRRSLAVGNYKGQLSIWDIETSQKTFETQAHDNIINGIDALGGCGAVGPPEVVTGSSDGGVKVWDVRQKEKPVAVIEPGEGQDRRECWTVALGNSYASSERVVASGYDNGDVKLFDMNMMKLIWEDNVANGVCSMEFDRKDIRMNKLLLTTLESKLHIYDCRTCHPKRGFAGVTEKAHKSTVWVGRHLPQNRDLFMTTGGNGSLCLWKYSYPDSRVKKDSDGVDEGVAGNITQLQNVTLSSQPVTGFDWSPDKSGLAACTAFDQILRLLIVTKLNRI